MTNDNKHLFLVTVDTFSERAHTKLAPSLKKVGTLRRVLRNTYVIKTESDLDAITKSILGILEPRDEDFIVAEIEPESCEGMLAGDDWDWINSVQHNET
jgi:hypothetical protein